MVSPPTQRRLHQSRSLHACNSGRTGIAKVLFNKDTEEILGVHIIGLHAADLIQECANAIAAGTTVRELSYMVRAARLGLSLGRCSWNLLALSV
jgi:pyruvate/2-oxoglutarate dehydrogenase complex dihydrolipoamide dehydrogenase (E3) component